MSKLKAKVVVNGHGTLVFKFQDEELQDRNLEVENMPTDPLVEGDEWYCHLEESERQKKTCKVRLLSKIHQDDVIDFKKVKDLDNFWTDKTALKGMLILLSGGKNILLKGHRGAGKTQLAYHLANKLKWDIYKVDCGMIQKASDLFGSDAADSGSTKFALSGLYNFIESAKIADREKSNRKFLILLDEINRVHPKIVEPLHGLFDDTKQIAFTTTEGTKVISLSDNILVVATMNVGRQYSGTFNIDAALQDRFITFNVGYMPQDFEENLLIKKHGIRQKHAYQIVSVARSLREAEKKGMLGNAPSPRLTDAAALLVAGGMRVDEAVFTAFMGIYEGEIEFDENGNLKDPDSERAQAYSHLKQHVIIKEIKLLDDLAS